MAYPATRKEWLETFINLADGGASSLEYRRKLGILAQHLPPHVKSLTAYRNELGEIKQSEELAAKLLRPIILTKPFYPTTKDVADYSQEDRREITSE